MNFNYAAVAVLVIGLSAGIIGPSLLDNETRTPDREWKSQVENQTPRKATFAGGCFWCIEEVYQGEPGVESAVSGFTGGKESTATYSMVVEGDTQHREAVLIEYYPSIISYEELLNIYWRSIDPTDPGGQFADRGYQYTTAIYAHTDDQYRKALESKRNLSESGKFDEPIATEINNFTEFYRAADRHQNYSMRNSFQYQNYKRASGRTGYIERVWN